MSKGSVHKSRDDCWVEYHRIVARAYWFRTIASFWAVVLAASRLGAVPPPAICADGIFTTRQAELEWAFDGHDAVFSGRVASRDRQGHVRLEIMKVWKGLNERAITLSPATFDDFSFAEGEYLVFASKLERGGGELNASKCSPTGVLSKSGAATKWLDDLIAHPSPLAGRWRLDTVASSLSGRAASTQVSIDQALAITVTGNRISTVTTTSGGPTSRAETSDVFLADAGKVPFTPMDRIGSQQASGSRTTAWAKDRRGLTSVEEVTRTLASGTFSVTNTHTWRLAEDGQTLTIDSLTVGPQGRIPTHRVFKREK